MHYVKPLLLGLIMEKNLKLEELDSDQTVAAIIATQKTECDPDPTL
jgi:hypothetical protein